MYYKIQKLTYLLLFVIVIAAKTVTTTSVNQDVSKQNENIACELILVLKTGTDGKPVVGNVKMSKLEGLLDKTHIHADGKIDIIDIRCKIIFSPLSNVESIKQTEVVATTTAFSHNQSKRFDTLISNDEQCWNCSTNQHEQAVVRPAQVEDIADTFQYAEQLQQSYGMTPVWMEQTAPSPQPGMALYEDQIVVYPAGHGKQLGHINDLDNILVNVPGAEKQPVLQKIEVVENYQLIHPNGTKEYKLSLSNGMVTYKKIYSKIERGKEITVQEGYDSVPIAGKEEEFLTKYYIADERGYNVYRVEQNRKHPELLPHHN